jgi:uncharacterized Rmd1/YagE family protein
MRRGKFAGQVLGFQGVQVGPLKEPETEELDFITDPSEQTRLQGDLIILGKGQSETEAGDAVSSLPKSMFPQDTVMARYAFSHALSRSTSLSALEVSLEEYLSSVANLPHSLEADGKARPGKTRVDQKARRADEIQARSEPFPRELRRHPGLLLGSARSRRSVHFLYKALLHFLPTTSRLLGYFHSVSEALEIKARTHSINEKITYAAELQSVLRQLLTEVRI